MPDLVRRCRVLGLLALLLVAPNASAIERTGVFVGVSIGGGEIGCDRCNSLGGAAVEIHLGDRLYPNFGIELEGSVVGHSEAGNSTLLSDVVTGALRYWPVPRVWIKAGLGGGWLEHQDQYLNITSQSSTAFAVMAAAGVEVLQRRRFVLDLQGRFTTAGYGDLRVNNTSVLVGFNWY